MAVPVRQFAVFPTRADRLPLAVVRRSIVILAAVFSAAVLAAGGEGLAAADGIQPPIAARNVTGWMARVGERVEKYYARAHSIVCEETVRLEQLGFDLLSNGDHVRELVYELRVAWDGAAGAGSDGGSDAKAPAATVLRELISVDGHPPRPGDEPGCMDPKPVSPEPLGLLLPHRQGDYVFSWHGQGKERGRTSVTLDYKPARLLPPAIVWKDDCVSIDLPGRTRGRVWLDEMTGDVLRLDEELTGQYEVPLPKSRVRRPGLPTTFVIERADSSIAYQSVAFHEPDETVMLPASIVSLQVIRNSGVPRLRTTQKFSKYRRFITGARIVDDPIPK
jgi:hypothetical protein